MFDFEMTNDEILQRETLDKIKKIELNANNLNLLIKKDILFIMDSDENMDFFDKHKIYYSWNKYHKDITEEDINGIIPELKTANYDYKKDFVGINLGLGHALLIRTEIYDDYMKILKNDIVYED